MKAPGNRQEALGPRQRAIDKILSFAYCLFLLTGCGYSFTGRGEGLPKDVRTVYVETFVNRSRDVTIDREIASALRSEFHRRGLLGVVNRVEEADAILTGVVRSLDHRVIAVNRHDEALQFEAVLIVDMTLRRRASEEILWRVLGTRIAEPYSGSRGAVVVTSSEFKTGTLNPDDVPRHTDIQLTESLSQEAKERLVERFARELHQRMMEMF